MITSSTDGTYDYFYHVPYGSTAEYVEDLLTPDH